MTLDHGGSLAAIFLSRNVQAGGAGGRGARSGGAGSSSAELQKVLLQGAVGLLRCREISGLKRLTQTCEERRDSTLLARRL